MSRVIPPKGHPHPLRAASCLLNAGFRKISYFSFHFHLPSPVSGQWSVYPIFQLPSSLDYKQYGYLTGYLTGSTFKKARQH